MTLLFRDVIDLLQPAVERDGDRLVTVEPKVHRDYLCNRREVSGTEGDVEGTEASRATDEFEIMSPPQDFGTRWSIRENGILYDILSVHESRRNRYAKVARSYRSQRTGSSLLAVIPAADDIALGVAGDSASYVLGLLRDPGNVGYYEGVRS
ncbi:MAG: hypothetical protein OXF62_17810 [Caldilineaceae bacterium]|nr:hypothetical protein [Caldilineaceae bacterium]